MKKITLVLGGIRSGKSHFAELKALYYSGKPVYIATSICFDKEMEARIDIHRERRGDRFQLLEEPHDITGLLADIHDCTVLVDCMTLNLSNRMLAKENNLVLKELTADDEIYLQKIKGIIESNRLNVIFVANEVGEAPVAVNKMARYFQDLQGRWNRILASYADEVYFIRAGIPQLLKKKSCFPFKISAPSYLLPTGYIENVTYLMDKVDDIQLLVFDPPLPAEESPGREDPLFSEGTISTLGYLARDADLTFSVHMPVKPQCFDDMEGLLQTSCYIIGKLDALPVSSYTFHYDLPGRASWETFSADEIKTVDAVYIEFFQRLKERCPGMDFSLENTGTPLSALDTVVSACGLSYCIDIGHLAVGGWDMSEISSRLDRASVVHLHGWEEIEGKKKDHRPVTFDREIFKLLESFRGVLTIENYHKLLYGKSLETLETYF
ncbi:MAG: hypothetical protein GY765_36930 [bacterium]|nr:hypothetical protein [bacterium]